MKTFKPKGTLEVLKIKVLNLKFSDFNKIPLFFRNIITFLFFYGMLQINFVFGIIFSFIVISYVIYRQWLLRDIWP